MARMVIVALLVLYLLAAIQSSSQKSSVLYCSLGVLLTLMGIAFTTRHIWLLHLPPELVPDCSPGFNYLMKNFPLNKAFLMMFKSSGECAGEHSTLFGVSLPGWTLWAFIIYFFSNIWGIWESKKKGSKATPL